MAAANKIPVDQASAGYPPCGHTGGPPGAQQTHQHTSPALPAQELDYAGREKHVIRDRHGVPWMLPRAGILAPGGQEQLHGHKVIDLQRMGSIRLRTQGLAHDSARTAVHLWRGRDQDHPGLLR